MNILNLFNNGSPESVLANKILTNALEAEGHSVVVSTHGNVVKKFPEVVFDKINVIGVDIPLKTMQWLLTCSPEAKIDTYRDTNSNIETWNPVVLAALDQDMFAKYGDISPCEQVLFECKQKPDWLKTMTEKEFEFVEEKVFATTRYFRFVKSSEDFSNRIDRGHGDPEVARRIVNRNFCLNVELPVCSCPKEQVWEVARFISFSHETFMLYEDTGSKRIIWTYGLTREWVNKHFGLMDNIWSHGVMLTFSVPKTMEVFR